MADGTYVNGWCLLTAVDGEDGEVLAWQWCARGEHSRLQGAVRAVGPSRRARMRRHERHSQGARANLAAHAGPTMSGARATRHQGRPDLQTQTAGRPGSSRNSPTRSPASTIPKPPPDGGEALNAWHERWSRMLAERTYAKDNPDDPRAATSKGGWWWTHLPLRRAYLRLERLFKDGTLFCFLDPALTAPGSVPRDGNRLEGGLNAALKRMLVNHRGLPEAHMRRACEWHCYMHSAKPDPAPHPQTTRPGRQDRHQPRQQR